MSRLSEGLSPNSYLAPKSLDLSIDREPESSFCEPKIKGRFEGKQEKERVYEVSKGPLTMRGFATFVKIKYHRNIGRTRLYNFFREKGVIPKGGRIPYKRYLDAGFFIVRRSETSSPNVWEAVPLITPDGQRHFLPEILEFFPKKK